MLVVGERILLPPPQSPPPPPHIHAPNLFNIILSFRSDIRPPLFPTHATISFPPPPSPLLGTSPHLPPPLPNQYRHHFPSSPLSSSLFYHFVQTYAAPLLHYHHLHLLTNYTMQAETNMLLYTKYSYASRFQIFSIDWLRNYKY